MFPILMAGVAGGIGYTVGKKVATDYLIPGVEKIFSEIKLSIDSVSGDCTCEKCGCVICECDDKGGDGDETDDKPMDKVTTE